MPHDEFYRLADKLENNGYGIAADATRGRADAMLNAGIIPPSFNSTSQALNSYNDSPDLEELLSLTRAASEAGMDYKTLRRRLKSLEEAETPLTLYPGPVGDKRSIQRIRRGDLPLLKKK